MRFLRYVCQVPEVAHDFAKITNYLERRKKMIQKNVKRVIFNFKANKTRIFKDIQVFVVQHIKLKEKPPNVCFVTFGGKGCIIGELVKKSKEADIFR